MKVYPMIEELVIYDIVQRGSPNQECILIKATVPVDIAPFAVGVGYRTPQGITPVRDCFFWFGEGVVNPADWIYLYTGTGEPTRIPDPTNTGTNHNFCYWGRTTTLFHDSIYTPFLMRWDSIRIAPPPQSQWQVPLPPVSNS